VDGSRQRGKYMIKPHSPPSTGKRQRYVRWPWTPGVQSHGDQLTSVPRGSSGCPAGQRSGGTSSRYPSFRNIEHMFDCRS
jgi:hypothetical protein